MMFRQPQQSRGASGQQTVPSPLVELTEVSKVYGREETAVRAVDRVTLTVSSGEFVLFFGPSGSGKTTLLSLIGGLLRPTHGTIRVAGIDLSRLSAPELSRFRLHTVGFVFQSFQLLSALTARENVELVFRLAGYRAHAARQRAEALLVRFGLHHRLTHLPTDLSGGEQQRVAIARALALSPPLLIADEPTAHLDSATAEEIILLLRRLVDDDGRTVLVASHDQRLVPVASRLFRCQDGRITASEL
ncbi:MAG: ABC transporter ATP-binding protein [Candidatus Binatia bacterium]|nr:ABC transporter ATP-binding protein [Candidatus Binatia bacterium]